MIIRTVIPQSFASISGHFVNRASLWNKIFCPRPEKECRIRSKVGVIVPHDPDLLFLGRQSLVNSFQVVGRRRRPVLVRFECIKCPQKGPFSREHLVTQSSHRCFCPREKYRTVVAEKGKEREACDVAKVVANPREEKGLILRTGTVWLHIWKAQRERVDIRFAWSVLVVCLRFSSLSSLLFKVK